MERLITPMAGSDGAPTAGDRFTYRIDAEDRLTFVAAAWLEFAQHNEAPQLSSERVQGRSLFSYIADAETQHLYRIIIDKVRQTQSNVIVPFRCDSPGLRRYMVLHISPLPHHAVQFEGKLMREERREHVPLLDPASDRSGAFVTACSWCKRIEADGTWLEVEEAVRGMRLFDSSSLPQISHGICGDCAHAFQKGFDL